MKTNPLITIVILVLAVFLYTCSSEDNSPGGEEDNTTPSLFKVQELPRSTFALPVGGFKPDSYRTRYTVFSVATGTAAAGEYRIGAKLSASTAPKAQELIDSTTALTRKLSSNAINMYLPYHIEGSYFDTGATRDYATLKATIFAPETSYSIYITAADGTGDVVKVLDIRTDAVPSLPDKEVHGWPPEAYEYTHRSTDPLVLIGSMGPEGRSISVLKNLQALFSAHYRAILPDPPTNHTYELSQDDSLIILIAEDFGTDKKRALKISATTERLNSYSSIFVIEE